MVLWTNCKDAAGNGFKAVRRLRRIIQKCGGGIGKRRIADKTSRGSGSVPVTLEKGKSK